MRVGIEVGGTFTDLVMSDGKNIKTAKVPSTPASPDEGAMLAIKAAGLKLDEISELIHGSTVATNAVLERKGGRVCFFVTQGTKDLLLIQRHDRRAIYDLQYQKPSPVVPRHHTYDINERIAPGLHHYDSSALAFEDSCGQKGVGASKKEFGNGNGRLSSE